MTRDLLESVQERLLHTLDSPRWVVGLSGGLDSMALLTLLASLPIRSQLVAPPPIIALHIHHGLSPNADTWSQFCQQQTAKLSLPCDVIRVKVVDAPRISLEEAARDQRYQQFADYLQSGDTLFLAHHLDDQLETILLRWMRGGGVEGLSGMPARRALGLGEICRPLLAFPRDRLEQFAHDQQLSWIDDESNDDPRFDRNFLRHQVMPLLQQRWPGMAKSWLRNADQLCEAAELNRQLAELDYAQAAEGEALAIASMQGWSPSRQRNLLRYWLRRWVDQLPSRAVLGQMVEAISAAADASPLIVWSGGEVRRYQGRFYFCRPLELVDEAFAVEWDFHSPLPLPDGGVLSATPVEGGGLLLDRCWVRFRRDGERCRPAGRNGSRSLKKLCQEWSLPPWLRAHLPMIMAGDEVAAVADRVVCEGYLAGAGERGWRLHWQKP